MKEKEFFKISSHKAGFFIKFENGIIISTQFAEKTYCKNYNEVQKDGMRRIFCQDAEVAIRQDGIFITDEIYKKIYGKQLDDSIIIHVSPKEWGMIFTYVYINYVIPELKEKIKNIKHKRKLDNNMKGNITC